MQYKKHNGLIYVNYDTSYWKDDAANEMVAELQERKDQYLDAFHINGFVWVARINQEDDKQRPGL